MAFCSLPCWTYFSAAPRTFCLLKPKPNAISVRTPASYPPESAQPGSSPQLGDNRARRSPEDSANNRHCKRGFTDSYGYQGLPKGSVRPGYGRNMGRSPRGNLEVLWCGKLPSLTVPLAEADNSTPREARPT